VEAIHDRLGAEMDLAEHGGSRINPSFALSVNYVEQFNVQVQTGGGVPTFGDCVPGNPFSGNVRSE
jgi:hypothetical protein